MNRPRPCGPLCRPPPGELAGGRRSLTGGAIWHGGVPVRPGLSQQPAGGRCPTPHTPSRRSASALHAVPSPRSTGCGSLGCASGREYEKYGLEPPRAKTHMIGSSCTPRPSRQSTGMFPAGTPSGRAIRDWERGRYSRWRGAAPTVRVSRSRAMPAPTGRTGRRSAFPCQRAIPAVEVPAGLHFHSDWLVVPGLSGSVRGSGPPVG